MDLSIIIVNWNTCNLVVQCLDSIARHPPAREFETFVVDNASADASAAAIRTRFPSVRLIENTENLGFARANNQAIAQCTGRYVLLLNSDTIVQPNALSRMVSFMEAHPDAGIVGANLLNGDGSPQPCFGRFPTLVSESAFACGLDAHVPFLASYDSVVHSHCEFFQTGWVLGASMLVRRAALDCVGSLDDGYFMYSEEIDLAYRIARAGWKSYVLSSARIVHLGAQSTLQMPALNKAHLLRSKQRYFEKFYGKAASGLIGFVFAASIIAKRCAYSLSGDKQRGVLWADTWKYFTSR